MSSSGPPPSTAATSLSFTAGHHHLEVERSEREARRIAALGAQQRARAAHFQNGRARDSGRDEAALARQMEDKAEAARKAAAERAAEGLSLPS